MSSPSMQVLNQKFNASCKALRAAKDAQQQKMASYLEAQQGQVQDSIPAARLPGLPSLPSSPTHHSRPQAVPPLLLEEPLPAPAPAPAPAKTAPWITELLKTPRSQAEATSQDHNEGLSACLLACIFPKSSTYVVSSMI